MPLKLLTNILDNLWIALDFWGARPHGLIILYILFLDKDLILIARSEDHAKAIENYCNRKVDHIVEDFNIEQLIKVIEK